jgi:hypothetical protein
VTSVLAILRFPQPGSPPTSFAESNASTWSVIVFSRAGRAELVEGVEAVAQAERQSGARRASAARFGRTD